MPSEGKARERVRELGGGSARPLAGAGVVTEGDWRPLSVAVVIATRGRPEILREALRALDRQSRQPQAILVSCVVAEDCGDLDHRPDVQVVLGAPGLPRQRNAGLRAIDAHVDIVVFFDDDFLPHRTWIEEVERHFRRRPDVAAITGNVLVDDIKGPGLTFDEARGLLDGADGEAPSWVRAKYSPYGCNMAFRRSSIAGLFFDERLVTYGWLEDRDFGGALAKRGGQLVQLGAARGIHLGVKTGRVSGRRLGYSQIVNPVYLFRKKTMTFTSLCRHVFCNMASNIVLSFAPEPYIDRFGRLRGNVKGVIELLSGRATPERAAELQG